MASKIALKNNINSEFEIAHSDGIGAVSIQSKDIAKINPVDTVAALRAMTYTPSTVWLSGYHEAGDGAFGSNIFRWNPTSTATDNGGTIIKLTSITTGRYELQYSGAVNVKWFGAKGDDLSLVTATLNSSSIQTAINISKSSLIPDGIFYTTKSINVNINDTTINFSGTLQQIPDITSDNHVFIINGGNVTLNNPTISQEGVIGETGTRSSLAIYGSNNKGNITINGGVIKDGASNCFQGGRNETKFIGTKFINAGEHIIYANGINGSPSGTLVADGLHFINCIFSNPGIGNLNHDESNHIQIRNYKNVTITNCVANGAPVEVSGQSAMLITDVENFVCSNSTFKDYKTNIISATNSINIKLDNCIFSSSSDAIICNSISLIEFNNCTFFKGYIIRGRVNFSNCIFKCKSELYIDGISNVGYYARFVNCIFDHRTLPSTAARVMINNDTVTSSASVDIINCELLGNNTTSLLGFLMKCKFNVNGLITTDFIGSNLLWFKHAGCKMCNNVISLESNHTFVKIDSNVTSDFILSNIVSGSLATYAIDISSYITYGVVSRPLVGSGMNPSSTFTFISSDTVPKTISVKNNVIQKYTTA